MHVKEINTILFLAVSLLIYELLINYHVTLHCLFLTFSAWVLVFHILCGSGKVWKMKWQILLLIYDLHYTGTSTCVTEYCIRDRYQCKWLTGKTCFQNGRHSLELSFFRHCYFFADIAQILTVYYHFVTPSCMSCASAMFGASGEKENQNFILHDDKHTNIRHRTSDWPTNRSMTEY